MSEVVDSINVPLFEDLTQSFPTIRNMVVTRTHEQCAKVVNSKEDLANSSSHNDEMDCNKPASLDCESHTASSHITQTDLQNMTSQFIIDSPSSSVDTKRKLSK